MSFELKYFKYLIIYQLMKYIFRIMMVKWLMNRNIRCIYYLRLQAKILNLN